MKFFPISPIPLQSGSEFPRQQPPIMTINLTLGNLLKNVSERGCNQFNLTTQRKEFSVRKLNANHLTIVHYFICYILSSRVIIGQNFIFMSNMQVEISGWDKTSVIPCANHDCQESTICEGVIRQTLMTAFSGKDWCIEMVMSKKVEADTNIKIWFTLYIRRMIAAGNITKLVNLVLRAILKIRLLASFYPSSYSEKNALKTRFHLICQLSIIPIRNLFLVMWAEVEYDAKVQL